MVGIAKFHKVSFEQFQKDFEKELSGYESSDIKIIYDKIRLPERGTTGSAGYDFFAPVNYVIKYNASIIIPTGIRCEFFDPAWFLNIMPRSGQGFKCGIHLANTCGIIDNDYFHADNKGHIKIKLVNDSAVGNNQNFHLKEGEAFAQGIIMPYGLTVDDEATERRVGGFGSTTK